MMKKYDALIAGYICVDLIPEFNKDGSFPSISEVFIPGKLIEIEGIKFIMGGAVANTGLAMKRFNKKVFLNGLVGNDFIGKLSKEWLDQYEVSEGIATTKAAGTAFSIVLAPPGLDRIFLESTGCNTIFDSTFINYDVIPQCRIFHFGYPPLLRQFYLNNGIEMSRMFSRIRKMGVITSLDFSLPDPKSESGRVNWPEIMKQTLPYVDIFVPSLEEVIQIMMPGKYNEVISSAQGDIEKIPVGLIRDIGKTIIDSGVKILLIKAGSRGAYLQTGDVCPLTEKNALTIKNGEWCNKEFWCNAYQADSSRIVNASGAGDTANAAFLSSILNGESPERAVKYAAIAGRNYLYCHNNYTDLIDWQTMENEIESEPNEIICL
jgi:sugar/nucleoside kinase (ribokinase family)